MTTGLYSRDDTDAVLPGAAAALADLRTRGLTHQHVRHVRSSQAFALNLFAPLHEDGLRSVMARLGLDVDHVDPPVFEFEDVQDRLAEASPRSRHRTQVDVLLTGTTSAGERVAALIEVKLAEPDFGHCSAYASERNPNTDVCATPGLFGGQPDACFQLLNHGHGHRRYGDYLAGVPVTAPALAHDDGGCWVRRGRSQPMRNLALAHMLVTEGDVDRAAYALCAPEGHAAIWRRHAEFTGMFASTPEVGLSSLLAQDVAYLHLDRGAGFFTRYAAAVPPQALAHLSATADELCGVWVMTPTGPEAYYPPGREAEADYGYGRIPGGDWSYLLDRLPDTSPYVAWWTRFDHAAGASAEEVFTAAHARFR